MSGWLFKSAFSVNAGASICLGDLGCAGGEVVFSSVGFAGCAKTPIADFGAGYQWGKSLDFMFTGCDIGPYRAVATAAQAGGTRTVSFGAGRPAGVSRCRARARRRTSRSSALRARGFRTRRAPAPARACRVVFHNPQTNTTYFVVKAPAGGGVEDRAGG